MASQYKKFWTVTDRIGATTSNAHDPALAAVAAGAALSRAQLTLAVHKTYGQHLYGKSVTRVQGVSVSGTTATVTDCHGFSDYGVMDKTGKMLTNGFPRDKTSGTLKLLGGVWKVTAIVTYAGEHDC